MDNQTEQTEVPVVSEPQPGAEAQANTDNKTRKGEKQPVEASSRDANTQKNGQPVRSRVAETVSTQELLGEYQRLRSLKQEKTLTPQEQQTLATSLQTLESMLKKPAKEQKVQVASGKTRELLTESVGQSPLIAMAEGLLGKEEAKKLEKGTYKDFVAMAHHAYAHMTGTDRQRFSTFGTYMQETANYLALYPAYNESADARETLRELYNTGQEIAALSTGTAPKPLSDWNALKDIAATEAFADKLTPQKQVELLLFLTTGQADIKHAPHVYQPREGETEHAYYDRILKNQERRLQLLAPLLTESISLGKARQRIKVEIEAGAQAQLSHEAQGKIAEEALSPMEKVLGEPQQQVMKKLEAKITALHLETITDPAERAKKLVDLVSSYNGPRNTAGNKPAYEYRVSQLYDDPRAEMLCVGYDYVLATLLQKYCKDITVDTTHELKQQVNGTWEGHVQLRLTLPDGTQYLADPTARNVFTQEEKEKNNNLSTHEKATVFQKLEADMFVNLARGAKSAEEKAHYFALAKRLDSQNVGVLLDDIQQAKGKTKEVLTSSFAKEYTLTSEQVASLVKQGYVEVRAINLPYFDRAINLPTGGYIEPKTVSDVDTYYENLVDRKVVPTVPPTTVLSPALTVAAKEAILEERLPEDIEAMFAFMERDESGRSSLDYSHYSRFLNLWAERYEEIVEKKIKTLKTGTASGDEINQLKLKKDQIRLEVDRRVELYELVKLARNLSDNFQGIVGTQKQFSEKNLMVFFSDPLIGTAMRLRSQITSNYLRQGDGQLLTAALTDRINDDVKKRLVAMNYTQSPGKTKYETWEIERATTLSKYMDGQLLLPGKRAMKANQPTSLRQYIAQTQSAVYGSHDPLRALQLEDVKTPFSEQVLRYINPAEFRKKYYVSDYLSWGGAREARLQALNSFGMYDFELETRLRHTYASIKDYNQAVKDGKAEIDKRLRSQLDNTIDPVTGKNKRYYKLDVINSYADFEVTTLMKETVIKDQSIVRILRDVGYGEQSFFDLDTILSVVREIELNRARKEINNQSEAMHDREGAKRFKRRTLEEVLTASTVVNAMTTVEQAADNAADIARLLEFIAKDKSAGGLGLSATVSDPTLVQLIELNRKLGSALRFTGDTSIAIDEKRKDLSLAERIVIENKFGTGQTAITISPKDILTESGIAWELYQATIDNMPEDQKDGNVITQRLGSNYLSNRTKTLADAYQSSKLVQAFVANPTKENFKKAADAFGWMDDSEKRIIVGELLQARTRATEHSFYDYRAFDKAEDIPFATAYMNIMNNIAKLSIIPTSDAKRFLGKKGEAYDLESLIAEVREMEAANLITKEVAENLVQQIQVAALLRGLPILQIMVFSILVAMGSQLMKSAGLNKK